MSCTTNITRSPQLPLPSKFKNRLPPIHPPPPPIGQSWLRSETTARSTPSTRPHSKPAASQENASPSSAYPLSLVAIVVVAVLASNHSSTKSTSGSVRDDPSTLSTSIKAICDGTLYPDSCIATLSPLANSTGLGPVELFHRSVQVAVDALDNSLNYLQDIQANDNMTSAALANCNELIELARDHLSDCSAQSTDFTSSKLVDDFKTWLSAAITHQHTCIDGIENSTETKTRISDSLKNSTEFASNSLAIFSKLSSLFRSVKMRRLTSYSDGNPSWLSPNDRRLLQSSVDPRTTANVVVAKDGSGKYKTIKAALKSVPEKSNKRFVIYVKKGVYYENVRVEKKMWNVVMIGDGKDRTIVSGNLNFVDGTPTFSTATFAVFGKGFLARDMGFRNSAGAAKHQAVALMSDSDQSVFYRCRFDAFQDTLYPHSLRQFYKECDVYGTVDFIFGNAATVLQDCNILPRVPLPGQQDTITAQGKVDPNQNTGISIHRCTVKPFGNLSSVRVYLGRPWKAYSTTVFMRSSLANVIDPTGWMPWVGDSAPDTIFYSEFENFGPGASTKIRVSWKGLRKMDAKQASRFTVGYFIRGDGWISKTGVRYKSGL